MIESPASKSFARVTTADVLEKSAPLRPVVSPLVWLNLICLDAPLVAITWQLLFAKSFAIAVANGGTLALFFTAWLIYLADRFADTLSLGAGEVTSLRQEFCLRHRVGWIAAIASIAIANVAVVFTRLDRAAIAVGTTIAAGAAVYLAVNRLWPTLWRVLPLKEISIGFIFAAGTMVGVLRSLTSAALPAWILFALLCSLNCICIAVWERELDVAQQRISIATEFPHVRNLILPLLAIVCLTSAAFLLQPTNPRALYLCLISSALLLAGVHIFRNTIQPDVRTALADLILLVPIVAFVV